MRILVTGATGYVGSAIAASLLNGANRVTGTGTSEARAAALRERGMHFEPAPLEDAERLRRLASEHDVVIHAAMARGAQRGALDEAATLALLQGAQEGRTEVFVYTSGVWILGETGDAIAAEDWAPRLPARAAAWRQGLERRVIEASGDTLRTGVIRPGMVYGGAGGTLGGWFDAAMAGEPFRVVGGGNRWPWIHRDDVAELYKRVIDIGAPGAVYHATDGTEHPVIEVAKAAAAAAGGRPPRTWALADARSELGDIAEALALDQRVQSPRSRKLGWLPRRPDLLAEIDRAFDEHVASAEGA